MIRGTVQTEKYIIQNVAIQRYLSLEGDDSDTPVRSNKFNDIKGARWNVERRADGTYSFQNEGWHQYLDCSKWPENNSLVTAIQENYYKWTIRETGRHGKYIIFPPASGVELCWSFPQDGTDDARLRLTKESNERTKEYAEWSFILADLAPKPKPDDPPTSDDPGVVKIKTTIITGTELSTEVARVARELIPSPPAGLMAKFRWLECTIKNETQFDVFLLDTHFDSGRYWTSPGGFSPFALTTFSACNGDNTFFTGATGGNAFRLTLDDNTHFDFSLGWTSPAAGTYKTAVVESSKGIDGYIAATEFGNSIFSPNKYRGKDKEGRPAKFHLHISASPGQQPLCVIKQIPIEM